MDDVRDQIAREVRRQQISGNLALILRHILDEHDALRAELAQLKTNHTGQPCARQAEWAVGAKQ